MIPSDTPMPNYDPDARLPLDADPDANAPARDDTADARLNALDDSGRASNPTLPLRPSRRLGLQAIHDASALSPRSRAFTRYCHGMTSPAIAAALGVHERTVRRWLAAARADAVDESNEDHLVELVRAVETQRAIVLAAWEGYERERALDDAILQGHFDRLRRRAVRTSPTVRSTSPASIAGAGTATVSQDAAVTLEEYEQPHRSNLSVRYLALAHAAQKEIARLHRLYEQSISPQLPPGKLIVTRRPDPPDEASDGTDDATDSESPPDGPDGPVGPVGPESPSSTPSGALMDSPAPPADPSEPADCSHPTGPSCPSPADLSVAGVVPARYPLGSIFTTTVRRTPIVFHTDTLATPSTSWIHAPSCPVRPVRSCPKMSATRPTAARRARVWARPRRSERP